MTSVGPLRAVLANPRFHRWHHTSAEEGKYKNLAGCCRPGIFSLAPTTCRHRNRRGSVFTMRFPPICSDS